MRVLYAIQGTGNGHLSRARDIIPILLQKNINLDILVSGTQADVELGYPITYRYKGLSFIFGKKGGVNMWRTYVKANSRRLQKEIASLPVEEYDLILNDFEPVSAWACRLKKTTCISLSHQAAVLAKNAPRPKKRDHFGRFILRNYAPGSKQYGFHFKEYQNNIFTPVIRRDIRDAIISDQGHYTVYLPSYSDKKILKVLSEFRTVRWQVFSKHNESPFYNGHIRLQPIRNEAFVKSMSSCKGILCGAGFETPAEALFLNKKLLVIPMKGQYEQKCNAAALIELGVPVMKSLKRKHWTVLERWLASDEIVKVDYPDRTEVIIDHILAEAVTSSFVLA